MRTLEAAKPLYQIEIGDILGRLEGKPVSSDEKGKQRFNQLIRNSYPIWQSRNSRFNYTLGLNEGSGVLYQQQAGEKKGSLDSIGDYAEHLYNRGKNWFYEKPYKGLGGLGAVLGGIAGLVAGPLGVLIGGALGAASGAGMGAAYYWAWGRGKRIPKDDPKNAEFLGGRSLGKWGLDSIEGLQNKEGFIEL